MNKRVILRTAIIGCTILVVLVGCRPFDKAVEPFNDAKISGENKGPAEIVSMPDGFSNVATKCDHGNRLYVIYHMDSPYGSVAVVAKDPTCPQN